MKQKVVSQDLHFKTQNILYQHDLKVGSITSPFFCTACRGLKQQFYCNTYDKNHAASNRLDNYKLVIFFLKIHFCGQHLTAFFSRFSLLIPHFLNLGLVINKLKNKTHFHNISSTTDFYITVFLGFTKETHT